MPSPRAGQVLVRVAATSVNLSDWEGLRGSPALRPLRRARPAVAATLGSDIAGSVEAVGAGVTRFAPGDEVYGDNLALKGGFAEYAVAPEPALAHKPAELTFVEASTIPQAGRDRTAGDRAGTARATDADQRRRRRLGLVRASSSPSGAGVHVTGVDNAGKLDFMRSLGADEVIDYRSEDFTRAGAVRPDHRPRRPSLGVRVPPRAGPRRHLPIVGGTMRALLRVHHGRRARSAGATGRRHLSCWR